MTSVPLTLLAIGFLLGFRHAFEPDHLAAVSTLATRQGSLRDAARLGLAWGLGHSVAVGVVVLVMVVAGWRIPAALQPLADLLVAVLLVGLGGAALVRLAGRHRRTPGAARGLQQSLGFGIAHGLAGSGAVVALMVAAAASRAAQLGYLGSFAAGTTIGMLGVSAVVAGATRGAGRVGRWTTAVQLGAAAASVAVGLRLGAASLGGLPSF